MGQPPTRARQAQAGSSYWGTWVVLLIAAAIILSAIVIVAAIEGLRIGQQKQTLEILETRVPARETVFPGTMPAMPTVVGAPQTSEAREEVIAPETPFRLVSMDTELRSAPGSEYAFIRKLAPSEQVRVLAPPIELQGQRWQQVKTDDGQVGWCLVSALTSVSTTE